MTTHVCIEEYQPENEDIEAYLERVDLYSQAAGTKPADKVPLFLTIIGQKNYMLLRDTLAPTKPKDKELDVIYQTLKQHFQPRKVIIAERFHFYRRNQRQTESITEYLAELRHLTTHCQFGEHLKDALRDRLVCGLKNEDIQ